MPSDDRAVLLALRALKLGDLLVAVPAVKGLRTAHPDHRLLLAAPEWLSPIVPLLDVDAELLPTPGLDEPLAIEAGSVDIAVNLHGNGQQSRGLLEAVEPRVRIGHLAAGWPGPQWRDGVLERERWAELVSWHGMPASADDVRLARPRVRSVAPDAVVVHVSAFYGSRQWPAERFADVVFALKEQDRHVIVTGGTADAERAHEIARRAALPFDHVYAGRLRLDSLAALIADASLLVSADTGAAHLASAYGTPSVVLFGPAPAHEWGPPSGPHTVLTDESVRRGDVFAADPDPALLAVGAGDVLAAAGRYLDGLTPQPRERRSSRARTRRAASPGSG